MEKSKKDVKLAARAQNVMTKYSDGTLRCSDEVSEFMHSLIFQSQQLYFLFGAIWTIKVDGLGQGCCRRNVSISTLILQDSHSFTLNRYLISSKKAKDALQYRRDAFGIFLSILQAALATWDVPFSRIFINYLRLMSARTLPRSRSKTSVSTLKWRVVLVMIMAYLATSNNRWRAISILALWRLQSKHANWQSRSNSRRGNRASVNRNFN